MGSILLFYTSLPFSLSSTNGYNLERYKTTWAWVCDPGEKGNTKWASRLLQLFTLRHFTATDPNRAIVSWSWRGGESRPKTLKGLEFSRQNIEEELLCRVITLELLQQLLIKLNINLPYDLGIHPRYICKKDINICPQKTSIRLFLVTLLILDKKLGSSFYKECIKFVVFYIF